MDLFARFDHKLSWALSIFAQFCFESGHLQVNNVLFLKHEVYKWVAAAESLINDRILVLITNITNKQFSLFFKCGLLSTLHRECYNFEFMLS
jgi:hypothetical protein